MDMGELFNPGCGGPGGAGCDCYDCEEWRRYCYWNHDHGGGRPKQFLLFASDDKDQLCIPWQVSIQLRDMIPDSEPIKLETPDGRTYSVKFVKFGRITLTTGWRGFVDANHIEENNPMLFVYRGNSTFNVHIFNSSGRDKFLPCSQPPCDHHVLNEQVVRQPGHVDSSAHFGYTMLPGSFVTKAQDDKLLEWAHTIKSRIPLFVAAMDESNVSLNDCHVNIPLWLVGQFKEEVVKIVAPNKSIHVVGAKKHNDDQIVLQSGWDRFVASQCIQQNDFLIFIIEGETRLKVLVLDPSGSEKTFAMGNSSNAQENPPPPPTVTNLSSEDNEVADLSSDNEVIDLSCDDDDEVMGKTPQRQGGSRDRYEVVGQKLRRWLQQSALLLNQEKKVKEKVRAIGSEFPVFVKVMTPCDVFKQPHVRLCTEYASACCLPLEQTPLLLELGGTDVQWRSTLRVEKYKKGRWIYSFWNNLVLEGQHGGGRHLPRRTGRQEQREAQDDGPSDPQVGNATLALSLS